jgi:two-component system, sensor histidine kinase and response regulator
VSTPVAPEEKLKSLANVRVLIVDNNPVNTQIVHYQVSSWHMRNGSAATAKDALAILRHAHATADPYDVVLVDMQMPDVDGLTLAHAIKSDPAIARTRIIMLSSLGQPASAQALEKAGVSACLTKPIRQSELFDCLVEVLVGKVSASGEPSVAPKPTAPPTPLPQTAKILLVEDNQVNQTVAVGQLRRLGYQPDTANNGAEAVELVQRAPYDVIFMDCQMPVMDGYEATRQIRAAGDKVRQPFIVALTAHAMAGDREKCLAAGMDDYIAKPVRRELLQRVLEEWERRHLLTPTASPTEPARTRINPEPLREFTGGDADEIARVMRLYFVQTEDQLDKMKEAIGRNDVAEVRRLAHSCLGSSMTCGVNDLVPLLSQIEEMSARGSLDNAGPLHAEVVEQFAAARAYFSQLA